mgnify:CR=1 FL=1
MAKNLNSRARLTLLAERVGQTKGFVSITGVVQFILDVLAWSAAAALALVLRAYLQEEQNISAAVQARVPERFSVPDRGARPARRSQGEHRSRPVRGC